MTPAETARLVRVVQAACPAQRFEDGTPLLWHRMLNDLRYPDCEGAVVELGKRSVFMAPAEIRAEVRRIRLDRLRSVPSSALDPDLDTTDATAWLAAKRDLIRSIADGEQPPEVEALPKRPVQKLLEDRAKRMPAIPSGGAA